MSNPVVLGRTRSEQSAGDVHKRLRGFSDEVDICREQRRGQRKGAQPSPKSRGGTSPEVKVAVPDPLCRTFTRFHHPHLTLAHSPSHTVCIVVSASASLSHTGSIYLAPCIAVCLALALSVSLSPTLPSPFGCVRSRMTTLTTTYHSGTSRA